LSRRPAPTGRLLTTLACWLPACVLVLVAANQHRLAHTEDISPWSGGGFGMFSSTDAPNNRHLHAFVQNEGIRREVAIPAELEVAVRRATTLPTRRRLERLGEQLASLESDGRIRWDEIELQVWALTYEPETLLPAGRLVKRERFPIAAE
jgi:hypothetical protein